MRPSGRELGGVAHPVNCTTARSSFSKKSKVRMPTARCAKSLLYLGQHCQRRPDTSAEWDAHVWSGSHKFPLHVQSIIFDWISRIFSYYVYYIGGKYYSPFRLLVLVGFFPSRTYSFTCCLQRYGSLDFDARNYNYDYCCQHF